MWTINLRTNVLSRGIVVASRRKRGVVFQLQPTAPELSHSTWERLQIELHTLFFVWCKRGSRWERTQSWCNNTASEDSHGEEKIFQLHSGPGWILQCISWTTLNISYSTGTPKLSRVHEAEYQQNNTTPQHWLTHSQVLIHTVLVCTLEMRPTDKETTFQRL